MTDNKYARHHKITKVICISTEPEVDLQKEGFTKEADLDSSLFPIDDLTEGDLVSILDRMCDVIDETLQKEESVLVWDIGGGVAAMAAYRKYSLIHARNEQFLLRILWNFHLTNPVMRSWGVSLPEAMTVITRARLKKPKRTLVPSERIIDFLHNECYQKQLDIWQVCDYNIHDNSVLNPIEPREKWIVERMEEKDGDSVMSMEEKKKLRREALLPISKRTVEKSPSLKAEQLQLLSTLAEVEAEVNRLKTVQEPGSIWIPHVHRNLIVGP